jgi:hypothetical protein
MNESRIGRRTSPGKRPQENLQRIGPKDRSLRLTLIGMAFME